MSLTFPPPHYPPVTSAPLTHPFPQFVPSRTTTPLTEDSSPHSTVLRDAFTLLRTYLYSVPFCFPHPFAALESPYDSDGEDPPSPALLRSINLPLPLFWPTPVPPKFCYASLFCLPSPTSCILPPFHLSPSPSQMVSFSPPNPEVTSIFLAYLSPSLFGPPLTPFCHTLS